MTADRLPLLVLSSRPWNFTLADHLVSSLDRSVSLIKNPAELTLEAVEAINPQWIFVPHWSHLLPKSIWERWPTVIFHMTDLPFGRGGSPLQNLIYRGHKNTMLTALRCSAGMDTGDIYLKEPLSLLGSAEEIYLRANELIQIMIERIVIENPTPTPQKGDSVIFSRRCAEQSNLSNCQEGEISSWYDHIRMLDAEGYPHAFLDVNGMRLKFRRVTRRCDGLYADVLICPISTPSSESLSRESQD